MTLHAMFPLPSFSIPVKKNFNKVLAHQSLVQVKL